MEKEITRKMIELIGWPNGDAIFSPGKLFLQRNFSSKLSQFILSEIENKLENSNVIAALFSF